MDSHIRALREAAGYSQDGFANAAGLDRSYYAGVERGERNVDVLNLYKIAEALNVSAGDLLL